jgi:DNA-binding MarR family transcriptional regulator
VGRRIHSLFQTPQARERTARPLQWIAILEGQQPPLKKVSWNSQILLAKGFVRAHYYVMRNTRNVVDRKSSGGDGYFSDPPLLVLASLADGPKHGYAMIEDIVQMCGTRLGPGTLYGAIMRLDREGLIEALASKERRQPYRLTAEGRRVLRARLAILHSLARTGLKRLEA